VGHLEFDLLFGTQDPEGIENLRIRRAQGTNAIEVKYDQNGQRDRMQMKFDLTSTKVGWRISNIHYTYHKSGTAPGTSVSLLDTLTQPSE